MRFSKKSLLSASLAVVMAASCIAVPVAASAADDSSASATENQNTAYKLASNVEDGNILHAFNWYFNDVKKYMKDIAEAGFTTVQVSPVQANKGTINSTTYACDWWVTYQPINFEIGNNYGTKADFKAMCDEADKYGVKIIVDIVANHMAQSDTGVAGEVHEDVVADLKDDPDCWHQTSFTTSDANRFAMTQYTLSGIPDLNTSNAKVQSYVKALLKECIDYGADGFRFDAAKHIELDTDEPFRNIEYASDFWKNITSYAKELKPDVFLYGEVLSPFGTDAENYTQYMRITDSSYGSTLRNALVNAKSTPSLANYGVSGADGSDLVMWVESHDNFVSGETSSYKLKHNTLLLGWGIIGARKDSPALYLVRSEHEKLGQVGGGMTIKYDELMGGPGNTLWQDATVKEINSLKNQYVDQSEAVYTDGTAFLVQRGNDAMVISNYGKTAYNANIKTTLNDGTYTDRISGSTFTVSGGVLTGTVNAQTVAVFYTSTGSAPTTTATIAGKSIKTSDTSAFFTGETAQFEAASDAAVSSIKIYAGGVEVNADPVHNEDGQLVGASATVGVGVEYGQIMDITVKAEGEFGTITDTYSIQKKDPNGSITAYFDTKGNEDWLEVYYPDDYDMDAEGERAGIYCFAKDADGNAIAEYPGFPMTAVPGTTYVKAELPANTAVVKFNEGYVSTGLDGRTVPPTVVTYGSATKKANREAGGFDITGSMIWTNGSWQNYVEPEKTLLLGDTDCDGSVKLADAILANKHAVSLITLEGDSLITADVDGDGSVKLLDAICIQKYSLGLDVEYKIGEPIQ